jgi:hypothetical protein
MADRDDEERPEKKDRSPKAPDQLSPNQALEDSLGSSSSQRAGDSGPVGNPIVSFPDEPGPGEPAPREPRRSRTPKPS